MKKINFDKIILFLLFLSIFVVIAGDAYKFLIRKDYNFSVETECNPDTENCFYRDCTNPDDCPPNGLENYRLFNISATDFKKCTTESCNECKTGELMCQEIVCGEDEEDECSSK